MTRASQRGLRAPLRAAAVAALLALTVGSVAQAQATDSTVARATQDSGHALVQLDGEPLSTYVRTKPPKGKKIDFASNTARAYRAQLSARRNDYKAWLRANVPQAQVTGEFDVALNAVAVKLNGATLAQVSATSMVRNAQLQGLYYPNAVDPDLALIDAEQAWSRGGRTAADAGAGVKVAIVDSGIDQTHPCFDDAGYAAQPQLGDRRYTNNKVIAARVFNNKLNQNRFTAEAVGEHGTHVAGTVGCNHRTPAVVDGVPIPYGVSGVAPRALLGNYNVFPGTVESARSEDILNALEAAYADGFDVANMSLGGGSHGVQDLLTHAVDNLDRANMVVAISNGNEGPGAFTVGSPGMAARALTAGASTVPHFVGAPVAVGALSPAGAASGDFATVAADLTAPLAVVPGSVNGLHNACTALSSLSGRIALVSRGTCSFSTKIRNAQAAGASAVLVVNNVAGDPTAMGSDATPNQPTIPAYMVSKDRGLAMTGSDGAATTISASLAYFSTANANIMAGFSSQGPTDVDWRVKPDVVAPGVNVLSSIPVKHCGPTATTCFAFLSGTSMASPHLAGSAAVIIGQHRDWSAAEVRSAVVNTADRSVLKDFANALPISTVTVVGAGLQNLLSAVEASVALDPVSLSFGGVPSGSGQTRQLAVTLSNIGSTAQTLELSVGAQPSGVSYTVAPTAVLLGVGESTTVMVTMQAERGASGPKQAFLEVIANGRPAGHAALYTLMK